MIQLYSYVIQLSSCMIQLSSCIAQLYTYRFRITYWVSCRFSCVTKLL